jgi:hypothetical protein
VKRTRSVPNPKFTSVPVLYTYFLHRVVVVITEAHQTEIYFKRCLDRMRDRDGELTNDVPCMEISGISVRFGTVADSHV